MEKISCPQNNNQLQQPHRSILVRILAWSHSALLILNVHDVFMKVYSLSSLSSRHQVKLSLMDRINDHYWNGLRYQELRLSHAGQRDSITWLSFSQLGQTSVA